jgi:hypothetical protein
MYYNIKILNVFKIINLLKCFSLFGIYIYINLSFLGAAVCYNNLWSYCSVSILPYVVGAQEIGFDVWDYSAI